MLINWVCNILSDIPDSGTSKSSAADVYLKANDLFHMDIEFLQNFAKWKY